MGADKRNFNVISIEVKSLWIGHLFRELVSTIGVKIDPLSPKMIRFVQSILH